MFCRICITKLNANVHDQRNRVMCDWLCVAQSLIEQAIRALQALYVASWLAGAALAFEYCSECWPEVPLDWPWWSWSADVTCCCNSVGQWRAEIQALFVNRRCSRSHTEWSPVCSASYSWACWARVLAISVATLASLLVRANRTNFDASSSCR